MKQELKSNAVNINCIKWTVHHLEIYFYFWFYSFEYNWHELYICFFSSNDNNNNKNNFIQSIQNKIYTINMNFWSLHKNIK